MINYILFSILSNFILINCSTYDSTNNFININKRDDTKNNLIKKIDQEKLVLIENKNLKIIDVYFSSTPLKIWRLYKKYAKKYPITQKMVYDSKKFTINDVKKYNLYVYENCVYDLEWYHQFHNKITKNNGWSNSLKNNEFTKATCSVFYSHTNLANKSPEYFKSENKRYRSLSMLVYHFKGILVDSNSNNISNNTNFDIYKFPNISVENEDYNKNNYGMISYQYLQKN